jgi:hypothetical protein
MEIDVAILTSTRLIILRFEFLKLARDSTDPEIKQEFDANKKFYADWEIEKAGRFDRWWKDHRHLFEERYSVRELKRGEDPNDPDSIVVEIPLRKSTVEILSDVEKLIESALEKQNRKSRKIKTKSSARFSLTEGTEPKWEAISNMLSFYRRVYLKNPKLRKKDLRVKAEEYFKNRQGKKGTGKVPDAFFLRLNEGSQDRVERNMRRYLLRTRTIILNVAKGEFPGKY